MAENTSKQENEQARDALVLPEQEAKLADAHARADEGDIAQATQDYQKARSDRLSVLQQREKDNA